MEIIRRNQVQTLSNPGVTAEQLLTPANFSSARVTITRVAVAPGAVNPRHRHAASEQIWVALSGSGHLLLADGAIAEFAAGDVARFADGDVHGFENTGASEFVYIAVTSPPIDFRGAYRPSEPAEP